MQKQVGALKSVVPEDKSLLKSSYLNNSNNKNKNTIRKELSLACYKTAEFQENKLDVISTAANTLKR